MARIVQKFGGTSVADIDRIQAVAQRVKQSVDAGDEVAVVVSAMSGTTNQLVGWTREISPMHDAREYDVVVSAGEQITVGLMAMALQNIGVDARSWLGWQIPMVTDDVHGRARIDEVKADEIIRRFGLGQVAADGRLSGDWIEQSNNDSGPRRFGHVCGRHGCSHWRRPVRYIYGRRRYLHK